MSTGRRFVGFALALVAMVAACHPDDDQHLGYSGGHYFPGGASASSLASTGLSAVGSTLVIDPTYTQRRVSGTCTSPNAVRAVAQDGTTTCTTNVAQLGQAFFQEPWQSGRFYFVPNTSSITTSAAGTNGILRCVPFNAPNSVTLIAIGTEVTTIGDVGSKVRLGLYADDGTGRPGALTVDAGQIAGDSATVQSVVISTAIAAGAYWACQAAQSVTTTSPTMRVNNILAPPADAGTSTPGAGAISIGFSQSAVTAGLPNPFTGTTAITGNAPRIFVKVQ